MRGILRFVLAAVAVLGIGGLVIVQHGFAQQSVGQQSSKVVAIHAGHVLDVKSGKLLSDQTIVIDDGKIASVGRLRKRRFRRVRRSSNWRTRPSCLD
ncbi:MAG: hypothetical protein WAN65_28285 [Candidatus Sulfotelmatobacter sp.]